MGVHDTGTGATYDSMTGLLDRMTFFDDVNACRESGRQVHIIMVQLSRLMQTNRKYGVAVGDQLIRDISMWLAELDEQYTGYRIANSRLMLLGPVCGRQQADECMSRIRGRFGEIWQVSCAGQTHSIMAKACFVHLFLEEDDTENDLLDKMNFGISVMENRGRDGVIFFDEEIKKEMEHRNYVLEEVRYAIEHKTFRMHYQPIYDCREEKFVAAESLIRLWDRKGDFISPGEFIPMAEENGLIDQISWIVLEKVCRFMGEHPQLPLRTVSVNLTGQQVADVTLLDRIDSLLCDCQLSGDRLRIEITERTVAEDFEEVKQVMQCLEKKGIRFYLDDFGTGYSNLSSVLSLPFEVIKFDQSLVRIMDNDRSGYRTIELLAQIMHENGMMVVAEGIETAQQVRTAKETGVDRIQGFYFAKPLSEEGLEAFLVDAFTGTGCPG